MSTVRVAVDTMSGDHGLVATIPAAIDIINRFPQAHLLLCGDEATMKAALSGKRYDADRVTLVHCTQVIANDDAPTKVIREKADSSMHRAIGLVKDGEAHSCISAGNTGALMAISYVLLRTIPEVERPAIAGLLPCVHPEKAPYMLDLGANVKVTVDQMVQFAVMGHVLSQATGHESPRVAILNIGSEDTKGSDLVRETAKRLQQIDFINYVGFVEPTEMLEGNLEVVISDGLIGNFVIKGIEGTIRYMLKRARILATDSWYMKLAGPILGPLLRFYRNDVHPVRYNGATFVGLNGVVIKSHGNADAASFESAIAKAIQYGSSDLHQRIAEAIPAALAVHENAS